MRSWKLALPLVALPLALAAYVATPDVSVRADEAETAAESAPIQWVHGWEAGRAAAAEKGKLMFVYVGRDNPP